MNETENGNEEEKKKIKEAKKKAQKKDLRRGSQSGDPTQWDALAVTRAALMIYQ